MESRAPNSPRVLLIDDHVDSLRVLSRFFEISGCEVAISARPKEAVSLAAKISPDLVLLDLAMPDKDGFEVVQELRALGLPRMMIVALSGYHDYATRDRCKTSGFDGYLIKPARLAD